MLFPLFCFGPLVFIPFHHLAINSIFPRWLHFICILLCTQVLNDVVLKWPEWWNAMLAEIGEETPCLFVIELMFWCSNIVVNRDLFRIFWIHNQWFIWIFHLNLKLWIANLSAMVLLVRSLQNQMHFGFECNASQRMQFNTFCFDHSSCVLCEFHLALNSEDAIIMNLCVVYFAFYQSHFIRFWIVLTSSFLYAMLYAVWLIMSYPFTTIQLHCVKKTTSDICPPSTCFLGSVGCTIIMHLVEWCTECG